MKTKLIAALITLTVASSAFAQNTSLGKPDCGQWFSDTQVQKQSNRAWVMGWLSGVNNEFNNNAPKGQTPPDYLAQLNSAAQAFLFVDNFCRANPLESVSAAADQLMADLIAKKYKK